MPLLSVVIPTRNRKQYLLDSIGIALENIKDVEVIVCDNSDDDGLRAMLVSALATGRVKYIYSDEPLSVVANFERSLAEIQGEYVIFIGDDDAIGPGLEEIVNWAKENEIDSVVSYQNKFIASYYWPGVRSKYFGNAYSAKLFVNKFTGQATEVNPVEALRKVAQRLGGGLGGLPRAYHGLISRTLIEKIHGKCGHLFGGISPDIYSATLIASLSERAFVLDFPFVIPGASPVSTAGQGAERSDRGSIKTTEHTARFGDSLVWDERIPEFYSPHTVWAYSLCKALELVPHLGVSPSFARLYACCFLYYRQHYPELFRALRALAQIEGYPTVAVKFLGAVTTEGLGFLWRVIVRVTKPRAGGDAMCYGPHETISSAYRALDKHITTNGTWPVLKSRL